MFILFPLLVCNGPINSALGTQKVTLIIHAIDLAYKLPFSLVYNAQDSNSTPGSIDSYVEATLCRFMTFNL